MALTPITKKELEETEKKELAALLGDADHGNEDHGDERTDGR